MGQAHQTDEYCTVRRIEEASEIYRDLIRACDPDAGSVVGFCGFHLDEPEAAAPA